MVRLVRSERSRWNERCVRPEWDFRSFGGERVVRMVWTVGNLGSVRDFRSVWMVRMERMVW